MHWLRLLLVLLFSSFSAFAVAVEFIPIYMPPPQAFGVAISDFRGDAKYLYLRTDTLDLIAIEKDSLLKGTPILQYLDAARWASEFRALPTSKLEKQPTPENTDSSRSERWRIGSHWVSVAPAYCAEGLDQQHVLRINGLKVDTGMDPCMALESPVSFDGKLWFGTTLPGEYADGPGIGVLVFDLARKQRVFQIRKQLSQSASGLMFADEDLGGVWVVNRSAIHFFDSAFRLVARWYYSEQFDPEEKNWSVLELSPKFKPHNPFAVAARMIQTPPARESGYGEEVQRALRSQRWASTNGIKAYQASVSELPPKIRSEFWVYYDSFERQHFPMWRKESMERQNGGRQFRTARDLIVCLYDEAHGARGWAAQQLVLNISVAVDGGSASDAQLYQPSCNVR